jgi:hypothetical protein
VKNQKEKRATAPIYGISWLAQENRNNRHIDIKGLERENETGRLKLRTAFMNQHFINELDKIGLQLIKITSGTIFTRGFIVFLDPKSQSNRMLTE